MKPDFRAVLALVPGVPPQKTVFTYDEVSCLQFEAFIVGNSFDFELLLGSFGFMSYCEIALIIFEGR